MRPMVLIGAWVLGLAWMLPGHYFPWASFHQEMTAAIGAAFIIIAACADQSQPVCWPLLSRIALVCSLIPLIQWSLGEVHFRSDAVLAASYVAGFALCVAAGATLASNERVSLVDTLSAAMLVASVVSVFLALCQWQGIGLGIYLADLQHGKRPYANLAQANHLATLLSLGVAAVLRFYEQGRVRGWVTSLALAFLGFGMVMTTSRTGWLFVLVLAFWLLANRGRASMRVSTGAVVGGLLGFACLVIAWEPLNEALLLLPGRNFQSFQEFHGQPNPRLHHWQTFWDALMRSPWSGYGWGQVPLAHGAAVLDHAYDGEILSSSHNLLLDLLIWNGLPLGLLICASLVYWFLRQARACRDGAQVATFAAVAAVFVHGMLEYPLQYTYFLLPVALLMGGLEGGESRGNIVHGRRWTMAVPGLILALIAGWIAVEYTEVEAQARVLRFVTAGIGVDKVNEAPEPDVILLDRQKLFHRFALSPARRGMSAKEVEEARRISDMHPFGPSLLRQALILGLNGRPADAEQALRRICWTNPPKACVEARSAWRELRQQYPELDQVPLPAMPPGAQE